MAENDSGPQRALIRRALELLGVRRLVLGIHDASFPGDSREDPGRGTPYSFGAERFLRFAHHLGFDGIQLGPQGLTPHGSASPYEAALFSRNPLNLPVARLAESGALEPGMVDSLIESRSSRWRERVDYRSVFARFEPVVEALWQRHLRSPDPELQGFLAANRAWLVPDALYDAIGREVGEAWFERWSNDEDRLLFSQSTVGTSRAAGRLADLEGRHARQIERHALVQLHLARAHRAFRARAAQLGLHLYGDLQIGVSARDHWAHLAAFLPGYRMGAPPSRTNPEGQPWGYPVLDPRLYGTMEGPGPARRLVAARLARLFEDYDAFRIDHPHGWVDPWVYRTDRGDPLRAVQAGARLFSTPNDDAHPLLSPFAIARADQLDPAVPAHADGRVRVLEPDQIARYATLVDQMIAQLRAAGGATDLVCEVLSTLPFPVRCILERHRLGRFRVTQKAKLDDPGDVYRSENAAPEDWVMLGNHDTEPIWRVVQRWQGRGELGAHAQYLAWRLGGGEEMARALASDPQRLVHAQFADAFLGPAQNVYVFFADLFGFTAVYNAPGTVSDDNWSLRAPHAFALEYAEGARAGAMLNLREALALALEARPTETRTAVARDLRSGR